LLNVEAAERLRFRPVEADCCRGCRDVRRSPASSGALPLPEDRSDFLGDIFGDIARPAFGAVEADDPNRVVVLTLQHVGDHRLQVRVIDVGFSPALAEMTEVVEHEIDGLILATRDDRRCRLRLTHDSNSTV
jgi:hypothetical protein